MTKQPELTPDQTVAIAMAHDFITQRIKAGEAVPSLSETLAHTRTGFNDEARELCKAIGSSLQTEKAVAGAVGLLALLMRSRN
ncbi:MAG: hypothetical protein J5I53_09000 [Bradyrhizobiaceae bacterium]|nr:hypothetical protein [Bradyrhizobiaceae bacterium]